MKIGVIADTHDNLSAVGKAVALFNDIDVGLVIHAGDMIAPFVAVPFKNLQAPLVAVFGNCDGEILGLKQAFPEQIYYPPHELTIAEKQVLVFHEPHAVESLAKSNSFDCIIYGHTHKIDIRHVGSTLVLNPGECGGWLYGERSAAIWDTKAMTADIIPV